MMHACMCVCIRISLRCEWEQRIRHTVHTIAICVCMEYTCVLVCDARTYINSGRLGTHSHCFAVLSMCMCIGVCMCIVCERHRTTNWKKNSNNNCKRCAEWQTTYQNRVVGIFFASVLCPRFTYGTAVLTPYVARQLIEHIHTRTAAHTQSGRQIQPNYKHSRNIEWGETYAHMHTHAHSTCCTRCIHCILNIVCQPEYRVVVFAQLSEKRERERDLDSNTNEQIRQGGRMYAAISRLLPTIDGWYTNTRTHTHTCTRTLMRHILLPMVKYTRIYRSKRE